MKVLLLGAGGMLARDLEAAAPPGVELRTLTRTQLDITDSDAVRAAIHAARPHVILNAAAYTQVDAAESAEDAAFAVNAAAPGAIGRAAAETGAAVVHFSTDYVFDGTATRPYREDDAPNPVNAYGRSKLEGETRLRESGAAHLLIRTQWLFGVHGRSFPRTMWQRAAQGIATRVVNDQVGRPTFTADLAGATWQLVMESATGLIHVANSGQATWYELARCVFRAARGATSPQPCSTADAGRPARRPPWSVLDTSKFEQFTGAALPSWEDALNRFLSAAALIP